MPRDITALGGLESAAEQFPVSLVQFTIPGFAYNAINDTDLTVYLNPSTNAVSMAPGAGLVAFAPYAGLSVPTIESTEDHSLSAVTLTVSNIRGDWSAVVAANAYRETLVSIWKGNLVMPAGTAPEGVSFQGAASFFAGRIEDIQPTRETAQIILGPHLIPWTMAFPYRTYSANFGFQHLPPPGLTLIFGSTATTI